jgi:(p)ppGpp synthase/HD superfamily hydrolase
MTLARAIEIAVAAHHGQADRNGAPYILHPIRVMMRLSTDAERTVGILHDVVEDSPDWPLDRLREEGFDQAILEAIDAMTKRDGEDYFAFVRRAMANPLARPVKRADLLDNLDASRLARIGPAEADRLDRYRCALAMISA